MRLTPRPRLVRDLVVVSGAVAVHIDTRGSVPNCKQASVWRNHVDGRNGASIGVNGNRLTVTGNSARWDMVAVSA